MHITMDGKRGRGRPKKDPPQLFIATSVEPMPAFPDEEPPVLVPEFIRPRKVGRPCKTTSLGKRKEVEDDTSPIQPPSPMKRTVLDTGIVSDVTPKKQLRVKVKSS